MRPLLVGLALALTTVPVAQAQQLVTLTHSQDSIPEPRRPEAPPVPSRIEVTPARIDATVVARDAYAPKPAVEVGARNVLAVIGGALVVVALVALLM
jgi:hypothetical protein